jgi:phenylalanyl-tRNA synthetase alpha chain
VTLQDFLAAAQALETEGLAQVAAAGSADALAAARTALVGRKQGRLTDLMAQLGTLPGEARREAGAAANRAKQALEAALDARQAELGAAARASGPALDLSMPARPTWRGAVHPVSAVIDEITAIFRELGFTTQLGPEAEHDWYNFGALNFPDNHPAMDAHDTLYLGEGALLRTHTSPVQVRTLQHFKPPVRVLAPGMVYRRDFFDSTHAPAFHQIEGVAVDEGISFVDLKATLAEFARRFYGGTRRTRFGPSYFPFTEPSAQMDVEVDLGDGKGLRWVEILGCGMMHPAVLESAGVDSEKYTGWAFGMGPGRLALSRHGIPDIRILYDSDVRFLEQFAR